MLIHPIKLLMLGLRIKLGDFTHIGDAHQMQHMQRRAEGGINK